MMETALSRSFFPSLTCSDMDKYRLVLLPISTALGLFVGANEYQNQLHKENPPIAIANISHCESLINAFVAAIYQAAVKPTALAHRYINTE